jgi:hypothetical protein
VGLVTNRRDGCLKTAATINPTAGSGDSDEGFTKIYDSWADGWAGTNAHSALLKDRVAPVGPDRGFPLFDDTASTLLAPLPLALSQARDLTTPDGGDVPATGFGGRALGVAATEGADGRIFTRVLVTNDAGVPLPGAVVTIVDDLNNVLDVVVSDVAGRVTLRTEPGDYYLQAAAGHYQPIARAISVVAPQDVEVELALGAVVTTELLDESGEPMPYEMAALYQDGEVIDAVLTDEQGRAVFVTPGGNYSVRFFDPEGNRLPDTEFQVTPVIGNPDAGDITFRLGTPPPPTITSEAPPATATVGQAYSFQVTTTGAPTLSVVGPLPPGLALSSSGVLSGTPTAAGVYEFRIRATNAGGEVDSPSYVITVSSPPGSNDGPPPTITSAAPPGSGTVGTPYAFQVMGTGQPSYSVQGSLPPGLSLSTAGLLSGTPSTAGTFAFKVRAANKAGYVDSPTYMISVTAAAQPLPSNEFTVPGKGKANIAKGWMTLSVKLPGAGKLALARVGKSPVRSVTVRATGPGVAKILLKPTRAGLRKLRANLKASGTVGKLKVSVALTYTPTGGTARTKRGTYTLRLKQSGVSRQQAEYHRIPTIH